MNQVEKNGSSEIKNKREEFKKEGTISKEKRKKENIVLKELEKINVKELLNR